MNAYQPVTADRAFILHRVLNAPAQWQALAPFAEVDAELAEVERRILALLREVTE